MMFANAPGFFCASTGKAVPSGQCSGGYYCTSGAHSPTPEDGGASGGSCPEGHYCPQGSSAPLPCPTGYYNNKNRSSRLSDCLTCPAGIDSFPLCLFMYLHAFLRVYAHSNLMRCTTISHLSWVPKHSTKDTITFWLCKSLHTQKRIYIGRQAFITSSLSLTM